MTFLADTEGILLDRLGIRHRDAGSRGDIAYPTSILVDAEGVVRWIYASDTYRERAQPQDVFEAIGRIGQ
ncbi:MAG: peroxiredoxin [Hyphomicrobiaceae bacterium]|jgi:peroxiredoxin